MKIQVLGQHCLKTLTLHKQKLTITILKNKELSENGTYEERKIIYKVELTLFYFTRNKPIPGQPQILGDFANNHL